MTEPQLTPAGLQAMIDALACLERSLFHLHRDRAKYHPRTYAGMAEGTVDEILKVRAQIDEAIGLTEFAAPARMYNPMPAAEGWDKDGPAVGVNGAPAGGAAGGCRGVVVRGAGKKHVAAEGVPVAALKRVNHALQLTRPQSRAGS